MTISCRWAGSGQPRVIPGRHADDAYPHAADAECKGCLPCPEPHCRICGRTHHEQTCAECVAAVREDIAEIVALTGALPAEAMVKGVDSDAAMLWGPTTDWEAWQHVQASVRVGRLPKDWCEVADNELHPLLVLSGWDTIVRDPLITTTPDATGYRLACECRWTAHAPTKGLARRYDDDHRNMHVRAAALIEDAEWLAECGVGMTEAARRLGYGTGRSLEKALLRLRRYDLARRLNAADPLPLDRYATARWSA